MEAIPKLVQLWAVRNRHGAKIEADVHCEVAPGRPSQAKEGNLKLERVLVTVFSPRSRQQLIRDPGEYGGGGGALRRGSSINNSTHERRSKALFSVRGIDIRTRKNVHTSEQTTTPGDPVDVRCAGDIGEYSDMATVRAPYLSDTFKFEGYE